MWWDLAFKIFNFAVFVTVIYVAVKKPVASFLKKRQESIKQAIEDAEQAKQEGEKIFEEYEEKVRRLDQEIERIRRQLINDGERERDRIIAEARQMAEKIKRQAEIAAQQEMKMVKARLQEEMAAMTVQLAEDLLKKHLIARGYEDITVAGTHGTMPARSSQDAPFVQACIESARTTYGTEPVVYPNSPGSGPLYTLCRETPTAMAGVAHANSRLHAPNENIFVQDYFEGIRFMGELIRRFAA